MIQNKLDTSLYQKIPLFLLTLILSSGRYFIFQNIQLDYNDYKKSAHNAQQDKGGGKKEDTKVFIWNFRLEHVTEMTGITSSFLIQPFF